MAPLRRYLTVAVVSLVAGLSVRAAPDAAPEQTWTFAVFAADPMPGLSYVPAPDAPPVSLVFYPTARSPRYQYQGPSPLQLLDSATGRAVADVSLSTDVRVALVILTPGSASLEGGSRYRVRVVDDDALRHRPGELLILNASGLSLSGTINRRGVTLHDGVNAPLEVGTSASINLRTPFKERSFQSFAGTIRLERKGRVVLLLLPPYHLGSPEVQSRVLLEAPETELLTEPE